MCYIDSINHIDQTKTSIIKATSALQAESRKLQQKSPKTAITAYKASLFTRSGLYLGHTPFCKVVNQKRNVDHHLTCPTALQYIYAASLVDVNFVVICFRTLKGRLCGRQCSLKLTCVSRWHFKLFCWHWVTSVWFCYKIKASALIARVQATAHYHLLFIYWYLVCLERVVNGHVPFLTSTQPTLITVHRVHLQCTGFVF